jgi:hypothetical protein
MKTMRSSWDDRLGYAGIGLFVLVLASMGSPTLRRTLPPGVTFFVLLLAGGMSFGAGIRGRRWFLVPAFVVLAFFIALVVSVFIE